jgi:hypothetical protein
MTRNIIAVRGAIAEMNNLAVDDPTSAPAAFPGRHRGVVGDTSQAAIGVNRISVVLGVLEDHTFNGRVLWHHTLLSTVTWKVT